MHIVSVVPPSSQTKGPQSNKGQNVQYFQLGLSQRSSNKQRKKITFKLEFGRAVALIQRLAISFSFVEIYVAVEVC